MSQPKNLVHVQTTVGDQGSVILDRLPYQPGQRVDVTISPVDVPLAASARYPLAGIIVATARAHRSQMVTMDRRILAYPYVNVARFA